MLRQRETKISPRNPREILNIFPRCPVDLYWLKVEDVKRKQEMEMQKTKCKKIHTQNRLDFVTQKARVDQKSSLGFIITLRTKKYAKDLILSRLCLQKCKKMQRD